ncbi:MAG: cytochrome b [Noviherbaspirillum sp.]
METRDSVNAIPRSELAPATSRAIARYTWQAMLLHWVLAVLVIGMLSLGYWLGEVPRDTPGRAFYVNLHKSLGVLALMLVLLRLGWRMNHRPPPFPSSMPRWQMRAASVNHGLLYLCILLQPLSGYLASAFSKNGVQFFGIPLPQWAWDDKPLRSFFADIHGMVPVALLVLISIHVLAALKHLLVDRDQVFQRMLPGKK